MSQKLTRTLMFAEEMVRACLPYVDERRETHHPIEMIEVLRNSGEKMDRKVCLRVMVKGRDRLIATCRYWSYQDTGWIGDCWLETEEGYCRVGFRCELRGDGSHSYMSVTPLAGGPGSNWSNLSQYEVDAYLEKMPPLRNWHHRWDIWHIGEADDTGEWHYGAWRETWIMHKRIEGTMDEVALTIAEYELAHYTGESNSVKRWEEAIAKLPPVAA